MSFAFALLYLVAEYLRPQSLYAPFEGVPLAQISVIGLAIAIVAEAKWRSNPSRQSVLITLFMLLVFVSYLFAEDRELASDTFVDALKIGIIYWLLVHLLNDRRRLYVFVCTMLLLIFKQTQYVARALAMQGFAIPKDGAFGSAGFFANPGDFGTALVSLFGISFYLMKGDDTVLFGYLKVRWLHAVGTALILFGIVASNSRGPALALAASLIWVWIKGRRKLLGVAALVVVVIGALALLGDQNLERFRASGTERDETGQQRLELWAAGLRMANERPLTGVGPNNFVRVNVERYGYPRRLVQHNTFIQALSELGYPACILFVMLIGGCFALHRRTRRILREKGARDPVLWNLSHGLDVSLLGWGVAAIFVSQLFYPFFWMLCILSVSLHDIARRLPDASDGDGETAGVEQASGIPGTAYEGREAVAAVGPLRPGAEAGTRRLVSAWRPEGERGASGTRWNSCEAWRMAW